VGCAGDLAPSDQRLFGGHSLIALVKRVAGHDYHANLGAARRDSAIEATTIHHQPDVGDAGDGWQRLHQGIGIRHLRHTLRVHEACDLQAPYTCGNHAAYKLLFRLEAERDGLMLEAIARTYLNDLNVAFHDLAHVQLGVASDRSRDLTVCRTQLYTQ
jgi:hypothetical protein